MFDLLIAASCVELLMLITFIQARMGISNIFRVSAMGCGIAAGAKKSNAMRGK